MDQNDTINDSATSGTGYLIVRVSTAMGAIPIENARVTVREDLANEDTPGSIIQVSLTDRSGKTERIALPAPPRADSMSPGSVTPPYASYNVDVDAPGYYRAYFTDVPVYDTITSIQPAILVPIAETGDLSGTSDIEFYTEIPGNPALRPGPQGGERE